MWVGLFQSVEGLRRKSGFPEEERIPAGSVQILPEILAFRLKTTTSTLN